MFGIVPSAAVANTAARVVDVPTREGVTDRMLLIATPGAKAAAILLAGGNGWLRLAPDGSIDGLGANFLVRSRDDFAAQGLAVAVVDAPSDRQGATGLQGFRTSAAHVADLKAVIAWLRKELDVPVWLVGTSRGTESAAYVATRLARAEGGPDGIVLTSSILRDPRGRPVTAMDLDRIAVPVLVVHHRNDDCRLCDFTYAPELLRGLTAAPRKELIPFDGGIARGDACGPWAYHGYNGIEQTVVSRIAAWILGA